MKEAWQGKACARDVRAHRLGAVGGWFDTVNELKGQSASECDQ